MFYLVDGAWYIDLYDAIFLALVINVVTALLLVLIRKKKGSLTKGNIVMYVLLSCTLLPIGWLYFVILMFNKNTWRNRIPSLPRIPG